MSTCIGLHSSMTRSTTRHKHKQATTTSYFNFCLQPFFTPADVQRRGKMNRKPHWGSTSDEAVYDGLDL